MSPVRLRSRLTLPRPRQPRTATTCDCAGSAVALTASMVAAPWGQISPSVYETGRLVSLVPWLPGHRERIDFLIDQQRPDGGWGGPDNYAIVPTLSAVEALLAVSTRMDVVDRGLSTVLDLLTGAQATALPDTPAIEIIVPYLVALTNERLDQWARTSGSGLDRWRVTRLPLPSGMEDHLLRAIRSILAVGHDVPTKFLHSLEVAGAAATAAVGVRPLPLGMIGASPAATAAWLGRPDPPPLDHRATRYLDTVQRLYGGPVPSVIPVTAFERSWVLGGLARANLHAGVPDELVASMLTALSGAGTSGGPGLPPDADTTSGTLHALHTLGTAGPMECLRPYEVDTHFCTWPKERTASATTNAHVLEAFTDRLVAGERDTWYSAAAAKTASWLREQQGQDGTWQDKWHASPYYATACCAVALARLAGAPSRRAVRRAVDWVLATQRPDGGWGRYAATTEETAYAIRILLRTGSTSDAAHRAAAAGYQWLSGATRRLTICPPLWHDKDLYLPDTIVRAAVLEALHLVHRVPEVMTRVNRS